MEEVVARLRAPTATRSAPTSRFSRASSTQTCFVHLQRGDVLAQAVSWAKAEQTGYWQDGDSSVPGQRPEFDFHDVDGYLKAINEHNAAWDEWFNVVRQRAPRRLLRRLGDRHGGHRRPHCAVPRPRATGRPRGRSTHSPASRRGEPALGSALSLPESSRALALQIALLCVPEKTPARPGDSRHSDGYFSWVRQSD